MRSSRKASFALMTLALLFSSTVAVASYRDQPPPLPGWTHPSRFPDDTDQQHGVILDGSMIIRSSPVIGEIDKGRPGREVAVGGRDGRLHVYSSTGQQMWVKQVADCEINGAPAVGQLFGDGIPHIVVGYGSFDKDCGGIVAYRGSDGHELWRHNLRSFSPGEARHAVISSPALADTDNDGRMEIGFGGFDRNVYLLNADGSVRWIYHAADTVWSSPAFANIMGDSRLEMVIGTDITANPHLNPPTRDGGFIYAFDTRTRGGERIAYNAPGSHLWRIFFDQSIYSSPVVGDVRPDIPGLEVITATSCSHPVNSTNKTGRYISILQASTGQLWQILNTSACVQSSPALGDLDDDGSLEIVATVSGDASIGGDGRSRVTAWKATQANPIWSVIPRNANDGNNDPFGGDLQSPVIADLDGNGSLEVAAANVWSVSVFNGRTGAQLTCEGSNCGTKTSLFAWYTLKSTPAVGDINDDGQLDLVIGGSNIFQQQRADRGLLYAWTGFAGRLNSPPGRQPHYSAPWPMFRGNAQHTGLYVVPTLQLSKTELENILLRPGTSRTFTISLKLSDGTNFNWRAIETQDRNNIVMLRPSSGTNETLLQLTVSAPTQRGKYEASVQVQAGTLSATIPVSVVSSPIRGRAFVPLVRGK